MEKMIAAMKKEKDGCCRKKEMVKGSCHPEPEAKPLPATKPPAETCCQRTETTCVCICCFQFMAPSQEINAFYLAPLTSMDNYTGFIQHTYKNPALAIPWQPPDFV